MEKESQAIHEPVERNGRYTSSIRKGSDGELLVVLKSLCSRHRFSPLPTGAGAGLGNKTAVVGDTTWLISLDFYVGVY